MNRDSIKGRWEQFKGRFKQGVGGMSGDRSTQIKGGLEELGGKIRSGLGDAADRADQKDLNRNPPPRSGY